ncbi:MAG: MarR family winged helix-turn-helix transcriptional regulator [Pseudomonadota bacterium]
MSIQDEQHAHAPGAAVPAPAGTTGAPAPSIPSARYDLRILQSLRQIIRAIDLHSRKLAALHRITGPQLVCLLAVVEHEPISATALSQQVYLSASTVVGILDRLEERGLVRRERQARDRRVVLVSATEQGRALALRAPSPLQDTLAEALAELPELEQAAIALSLQRIVELMQARHIDASPMLDTGPLDREVK